jgi:hypothetical protein
MNEKSQQAIIGIIINNYFLSGFFIENIEDNGIAFSYKFFFLLYKKKMYFFI